MKVIHKIHVERLSQPLTEGFEFQIVSLVHISGGMILYTLERPEVNDMFLFDNNRYSIQFIEDSKFDGNVCYKSSAYVL